MTQGALQMIASDMEALNLQYALGEWKSHPEGIYFVGEYQEVEPLNEDGEEESEFLLTGFARGDVSGLEDAKDRIREYYDPVHGRVAVAKDKSSVAAVFYSRCLTFTGEAEVKKVQINLKVKEWRKRK